MKSFLMALIPVCCLAVFVGCGETASETVVTDAAEPAAPAVEVANTVCPIMGNEIDLTSLNEDTLVEWNGKKVAFCCPPCNEKWVALTDDERAEKLANPPSHGE
ncbi:MAG: hypothetical protein ACO3FE_18665 [Planctomycetaceae bacterium]|jgi:hypothetical protein